MIESARRILNERLALHALEYPVPRVTLGVKYMLGGLTAFLLLVLRRCSSTISVVVLSF